jgi:hypothetical protein
VTALGFESLHWGGPAAHDKVQEAIAAGAPLLSRLDARFDAFSDIGLLSRRFAILDEQYRGSRFVLTVRRIDAWIESRRRHVQFNLRRRAAGEYDGTFLVVDEDAWRREWIDHISAAHEYFKDRDDFLEVDLTCAPEWEPLCRLLGVAEPAIPFPCENTGASLSRWAPEARVGTRERNEASANRRSRPRRVLGRLGRTLGVRRRASVS